MHQRTEVACIASDVILLTPAGGESRAGPATDARDGGCRPPEGGDDDVPY